jgi:hypothetical protein
VGQRRRQLKTGEMSSVEKTKIDPAIVKRIELTSREEHRLNKNLHDNLDDPMEI